MKLADVSVGDKVWYWHDAGCRPAEMVVCEVIKIGKAKIKVRAKFGSRVEEGWKYPHFFAGKTNPTTNL